MVFFLVFFLLSSTNRDISPQHEIICVTVAELKGPNTVEEKKIFICFSSRSLVSQESSSTVLYCSYSKVHSR